MIRRLLILFSGLICLSVFCQIPHGSIHVDIKSLLANDRSLSTADNNSISRLLNENDLLIFPSYATIEWTKSSDSLSINYLTDTDLINIHKGKLDEINKNIISLRSGWVNLKHSKDNYYVTKIIKKKKEMIL